MPEPLTLVIDQGTHATRALAFSNDGRVLATARCPVALHRRSAEMIEQDAGEIVASTQQVVTEVLTTAVVQQRGVAQAGLATQRSSVVAWDRQTGQPLAPLLSWQDRRAAQWLTQFEAQKSDIKARTGLPLSPHYGASKLRWLLDQVPAVRQAHKSGRLAFGPLASFLLFHLLRERPLMVDDANAARSQLWHIDQRDWDPWLLDLFGIPASALPSCCPISHPYGRLKAADVPVTAVNGDQNAAVYSLGQPAPQTAIINLGTGAFVLVPTGTERIRHPALLSGLTSSSAHGGEYTLEGTVNGAGAALSWAAETWNIPDLVLHLDEWLQRPGELPLFLNTIGGLGSPWWRPGPAAALVGSGEPWQQAVAVAESILFLLQANLEAIVTAGLPVTQLRLSGGLARSDALCQRLADLSGCAVYRPAETEATARGIAWLAAGRPTQWPETEPGHSFRPQPAPALQARYHRFYGMLAAR